MKRLHKIVLLEDHPLTRMGVKQALSPMYQIAFEASSQSEFFKKISNHATDLVLLDILLPDGSGIEVARRLKAEYPEIKILVFSIDTNESTVRELLEIGVEGLLSKRATEPTIVKAVATVLEGEHFYLEDAEKLERDILISKASRPAATLTEREQEVLRGFCKGMTSFEIANALCISQRTVENHKQHIFRKCGINNTVEMMIYALKSGIVSL